MIGAGLVRNFAAQINQVQAAVLALLAAVTGSSLVGFQSVEAGAVPRTVQDELRAASVTPEQFGAVGDGVTDDTLALTRFFAAAQGRIGALGPKTYYQAGRIASAFANCTLVGVPGKTKITSNFSNGPVNPEQAGFLQLLAVSNFHVIGVEFASTLVSAPLDTGSALVFSYQANVKNCSFRHCKFTAPNANTSGLSFYTRVNAGDLGATIDGLWVEDCDFQDVGAIGCTIMNRSVDLTAAQRVYFNRNKGKNLGLSGSFGFLVSFDGYGQHFTCNGNLVENALGIGIENTNWCNGEFQGNRFRDFSRVYAPLSFSGTSSGLLLADNRTMGPASSRCNFIGVSSSRFRGNYFEAAGDYAVHVRAGSGNTFEADTYKSDNIYAALIGNNATNTADNKWSRCTFDNSASAANSSVVRFDGVNTTRNLLDKCAILKGAGGTLTDQVNNAARNFVDDYTDAASSSPGAYLAVAMPDADYTFASRDQTVRYRSFRFTGALTADRTVNFPAGLVGFDFWNDTNANLTLTPAGGGGFIVFAGQRVRVVSNGVNLQGWGALGGSWNSTQGLLTLGSFRLWVDAAGRLRIKQGVPTFEADGTIVGTQV